MLLLWRRRVWIGEYSYPAGPAGVNSDASQLARTRQTIQAGLEWGTPFVLFW